jgi:hypothetical protein
LNGAYYIVAANPSSGATTTTFTVPGLIASSVHVFGEGRSLPVRSGRFTDSFGGLVARVYVAAPPGV